MRYFIILLIVAFMGCRSGAGSHEGHDHTAEAHSHEGHDHAHDHEGHEGHDHAAEEAHDHDGHEGHDHEEPEEEAGHGDEIIFTRAQAEAAGLTIEPVEPGAFSRVIKTSGRIQSPQGGETVVAAASNGIVSFSGDLTEGRAVSKGGTLATISARGLVDGDPAARARIELETAKREYRRAEGLVKDQIISQKEFEETRRRYETARAALPEGTTNAGVRVASPLSGYIKNILVSSGEYVSTGQPIATVSQTGNLQLRAEVQERHFSALASIRAANFRTSYSETVHNADRLLSYGRAAEGGYIPVLFEFPNVGDAIPGAYTEVWLLGAPFQNVISVPRSALTEEQGLYFVYLQVGAEDYAKREVSIGDDNGKRVQITDGLTPGDRVVTHGAIQVRLAAMSGIIPEGHSHAH